MRSWVSVGFVCHDPGSVSINIVHHSSHIDQNIKMLIKSIKKQSKCLVSILIKMSFTLYTAEFYSLTNQLQLKVKKIADWVRCNIIYSKISQNSRTYKMKNMWQNEKHMILKSHSVYHVLNKVHNLILTSVCAEHFLNLRLCQHWSDLSSYTCTWAFTCSQWLLWECQLDDLWVHRSYIWKISLLI